MVYLAMTGQIQRSIFGYLLVKTSKLKFLMAFHHIICRKEKRKKEKRKKRKRGRKQKRKKG